MAPDIVLLRGHPRLFPLRVRPDERERDIGALRQAGAGDLRLPTAHFAHVRQAMLRRAIGEV